MSSAADRPDRSSFEPNDTPEFALDFMTDDEEDPTELTIFSPHEDDIRTHWITVDFDSAVPLQTIR